MVTDKQVRLLRKRRMKDKTLEAAATAAGMTEKTARKWQQGPLPSATKTPREAAHAAGSVRRCVGAGDRVAARRGQGGQARGEDDLSGARPTVAGEVRGTATHASGACARGVPSAGRTRRSISRRSPCLGALGRSTSHTPRSSE